MAQTNDSKVGIEGQEFYNEPQTAVEGLTFEQMYSLCLEHKRRTFFRTPEGIFPPRVGSDTEAPLNLTKKKDYLVNHFINELSGD